MRPAADNNTPAAPKRGTNPRGERTVNGYSSIKGHGPDRREDSGFTLVEILIAIVLVGILSAVVVVGIGALTNKGATSACEASHDAAKAGTVVYYATQGDYPVTMEELTDPGTAPVTPPALEPPTGSAVAGATLSPQGAAWTLTMTSTSNLIKPTFACSTP